MKFFTLLITTIIIVVILLIIELYWNEKKATYAGVLPETFKVVGKFVIYNSKIISTQEALNEVEDKDNYISKKLEPHISYKFRKPFQNAISELKEEYATDMPITFIYKTAVNIADISRDMITPTNQKKKYMILMPKDSKVNAFIDKDNYYIIDRS